MEALSNSDVRRTDAIVVGGGLAGLTAAAFLARAGRSVLVVERARDLGGRAGTTDDHGFLFNFGPHALYNRGAAVAALCAIGVSFAGGTPGGDGAFAYRGGRLSVLPGSTLRLLTTGLFGFADRLEGARVLATLGRMRAETIPAGRTYAEWLEGYARRPAVRDLLAGLGRVATYSADLDRLDARAAVAQVVAAITGGVRYVDGGWRTLVDGLRTAAEAHGATLATHTRVVELERTDRGIRVRLADGRAIESDAVVLATSPQEAARMLPDNAALARSAADAVPVRAASLDLGLAHLPRPDATFALGLDRPLYLSVHSAYARLAPAGGVVLHAMAYLPSDDRRPAREVEREIEALIDAMQPGWRDHVVARRLLPSIAVSNALVTAEGGGLGGRFGPEVPGETRVFVAGDWVGGEGMLADAAVASGRRAAELAVATLGTLPQARREAVAV